MAVCKDCGGRARMLSDICDDCSGKREITLREQFAEQARAKVAAEREEEARWYRLPNGARAWEYHVIKFSPSGVVFRGGNIDIGVLSQELNKLGAGGWEVVGVITSAIAQGATNEVAILLKRPT